MGTEGAIRIAADASYRDVIEPWPRHARVEWFESCEEACAAVVGAEVLLLGPDRGWGLTPLLEVAPKLRWVHTRAAGVDSKQLQPLDQLRERDIVLTNGSGISSIPIAEYVLATMLAVTKQLPQLLDQQARHEWVKPAADRELRGSRVLLLGYGDVAREVAKRLRPFGVGITAVRRRSAPELGVEVIGPDDWRPRLDEFDWVIVTTPLTAATRGMVGPDELAGMHPDAWLVNVSRGGVVDQDALVDALRRKTIGGAILDVTVPEPLPEDHELWSLPNAIVTPHCAWVSGSFARRAGEAFLDNLGRWQAGFPLQNVVDIEAGY